MSGEVLAARVVDLKEINSLEGENEPVKVEDGRMDLNDAQVVPTDILADSGVIYGIVPVLLPPIAG